MGTHFITKTHLTKPSIIYVKIAVEGGADKVNISGTGASFKETQYNTMTKG